MLVPVLGLYGFRMASGAGTPGLTRIHLPDRVYEGTDLVRVLLTLDDTFDTSGDIHGLRSQTFHGGSYILRCQSARET